MVAIHINQINDKQAFINAYTRHNNKTVADAYSVMEHVPCDVAFESETQAGMFCTGVTITNTADVTRITIEV